MNKGQTMKETEKQFLEAVEKAKQRLAAGEKPEDVFDWCGDFHDGFAAIVLNDKDNYINIDGKLLSTTWFDLCEDFHEGFAVVELGNKCNFIDHNGNILSDMWFNDCERFNGHFARVVLNGKDYYVRKDGVLCDYDTKEPVNDTHPDKEKIIKYLKGLGYTITLNGDVISREEELKDMERYVKYQKEKLIEKACDWLLRGGYFINNTETIDDFKKAMEE